MQCIHACCHSCQLCPAEIRRARLQHKKGQLSDEDYEKQVRPVQSVLAVQTALSRSGL